MKKTWNFVAVALISVATSGCQTKLSVQSDWSVVQLRGVEATDQFVLEKITSSKAELLVNTKAHENVNLYAAHYLAKAPIQATSGYVFVLKSVPYGVVICLRKPNQHESLMTVRTAPLALVNLKEAIGGIYLTGYCAD